VHCYTPTPPIIGRRRPNEALGFSNFINKALLRFNSIQYLFFQREATVRHKTTNICNIFTQTACEMYKLYFDTY